MVWHQYREELKRLSKQLLIPKKNAQELFLRCIQKNKGKGWTDFYKYIKRRKENWEDIVSIKVLIGLLITESI
jgi:hypothetical protein